MPKKYMEQDQISGPAPQKRFNLWLIATIVLAALLIAGGVVFAWQKSAGDKVKNDLQSQINTLQNQVQQLTKTNTNVNAENCLKEGETSPAHPEFVTPDCCSGLTQIKAPYAWGNDSSCPSDKLGIPWDVVCTYCGNGVCGTGENKCNCPADCKTADVIANWKTYANNKFGYSVEYPSNWYYKDYNDVTIDNVLLSRVVFSGKALPSDIGKMDPTQSISIWVEDRPFAEARAAFLQGPFMGPVSETTITIDNTQATKLSALRKAGKYPSVEVMISKNGKVYTVVGIDSPSVSAALDRVLATFKFTN